MANTSRRERLRAAQEAAQKRRRARIIIAIGVGVGALIAIAVMVWSSLGATGGPGAGATTGAGATRPPNATAENDGIVTNPGLGKAGVPVVGLYFDYQCPHCITFEEKYGLTLNNLAKTGDISLINHTKVFLDKGDANGLSHKAAIAAACADNAGAYSAYHNAIFAGQPTNEGTGYTTQQLRVDFAGTAGITGDKLTGFQQCYDSRTTQSFVEGTNEKAAADGVNSTPTIMVNGTKLDNNTIFTQGADAFRQTVLTTKGNG